MHQQTAQYDALVQYLEPLLVNRLPKVVAIDGKNGSGKTTLGRYLAWRFDISLIETDLFKNDGWNYREDELKAVLYSRLDAERPVLVEGIAILDILHRVETAPDCHVYVENVHPSDATYDRSVPFYRGRLSSYEFERDPKRRANFLLQLKYDVFA